jgi:hypothetical protein
VRQDRKGKFFRVMHAPIVRDPQGGDAPPSISRLFGGARPGVVQEFRSTEAGRSMTSPAAIRLGFRGKNTDAAGMIHVRFIGRGGRGRCPQKRGPSPWDGRQGYEERRAAPFPRCRPRSGNRVSRVINGNHFGGCPNARVLHVSVG